MQTILAVGSSYGSSLFILHDFCINIHVCCNSYVNCTVQTATHLEREKMRFDICICTSRRNSHVEIGQSLPHPAIRRSVSLSVNINVQTLIAGSRKHLEG